MTRSLSKEKVRIVVSGPGSRSQRATIKRFTSLPFTRDNCLVTGRRVLVLRHTRLDAFVSLVSVIAVHFTSLACWWSGEKDAYITAQHGADAASQASSRTASVRRCDRQRCLAVDRFFSSSGESQLTTQLLDEH